VYLFLYAVGEKDTTVKQTSMNVVLLAVCVLFCVSELPRLIHNSASGRLTYLLSVHSLYADAAVVP